MIFLFQMVLTFLLMIIIYFSLSRFAYGGEADNFCDMILFQPILAIIFSIITIVVSLVIGLPIRLSKRVRKWWASHFYIALFGLGAGLILLWLSTRPAITESVSSLYFSIPGWFLTAFCTLHLYPGRSG
jgi:energy-converting hydrogenase Eha subunit A